jgi:hypothetical protein
MGIKKGDFCRALCRCVFGEVLGWLTDLCNALQKPFCTSTFANLFEERNTITRTSTVSRNILCEYHDVGISNFCAETLTSLI